MNDFKGSGNRFCDAHVFKRVKQRRGEQGLPLASLNPGLSLESLNSSNRGFLEGFIDLWTNQHCHLAGMFGIHP